MTTIDFNNNEKILKIPSFECSQKIFQVVNIQKISLPHNIISSEYIIKHL
jgi:hypothetical protein